jgi:hypothetical protein
MRSKISLIAARSPASALAASLRAISCRMLALPPSPSSPSRRSSASSVPHRPHGAVDGGRRIGVEAAERTCLYPHRHARTPRRQHGAGRQRALRRGAGAVTTAAPEIGERRYHRSRIVLVTAEPGIALATEQAADGAGRMAMIDAERLFRRLSAGRAHAVLFRQKRVVIRR